MTGIEWNRQSPSDISRKEESHPRKPPADCWTTGYEGMNLSWTAQSTRLHLGFNTWWAHLGFGEINSIKLRPKAKSLNNIKVSHKSAVCSSIQLYNRNSVIWNVSLWRNSIVLAQHGLPPSLWTRKYQMLLLYSFWKTPNSLAIGHLCSSANNQRHDRIHT